MKKIEKAFRLILIGFLAIISQITIAQRDTLCVANFSFEESITIGKPSVIQFKDLSTGNPTDYLWNFGDGSTSNASNPFHYFPEAGNFIVTLSISNEFTQDEISKEVNIEVPLEISFTFKLDSNYHIPNTFHFASEIEGSYDYLLWDFGEGVLTNVEDTTHSYTYQDTDYQVCLTAKYYFNDTSTIQKITCQGLTTSEYYNLGGQVFFGDSLMNNPYPTGDTGIAYLYRMDKNNIIPIDTNYFVDFGYFWFAAKLKSYYIIKTHFTENSNHSRQYAPTYVGNTTQWDEAEIINLAQDKFREDLSMVEKKDNKSGTAEISGSIFDILNIENIEGNPMVYLYNTQEELIDYKSTDSNGDYYFDHVSSGHYLVNADITGVKARSQMVIVNGKGRSHLKSESIEQESIIFPNPAIDYSILEYYYSGKMKEAKMLIYNSNGNILREESITLNDGLNYIHIDLENTNKGVIFVKIADEQTQVFKLIHN
ncbi:PKD domain-containing protein [Lentimicrobium sp. S6]|uniref:PKD domain-containing protein n=1 Tax=Lentimicrobium sp. S6 TaxID=2735872 RepID=UPI0015566998|nr:PKD domain-containing protein [Lentimicrobium sp. S6]NPD44496.1 PKD domain-containing protein [Lentimicrobium sp. S6]